jgi:predicted nucleic acid-binding protein
MPGNAVFLDTNGWLALLNASDQLHSRADSVWRDFGQRGYSIVLTDWIIAETGNGLARTQAREGFSQSAGVLLNDPRCRVVFITSTLLRRTLDLYEARTDKQWGLVDCASFIVMTEEKVAEALTSDRHFEQAGFKALLPIL